MGGGRKKKWALSPFGSDKHQTSLGGSGPPLPPPPSLWHQKEMLCDGTDDASNIDWDRDVRFGRKREGGGGGEALWRQ